MIQTLAGVIDAYFISALNGLAIGILLFTLAVGLSLIFGLMDVLNLAHGATFLVGSFIAFQLASSLGFWWAALIAVVVGLAIGLVLSGALRPIAGRGHLDQALLTLGFAFVLRDLSAIIWGRDFQSVEPPAALQGTTELFGQIYPTYRLGVIAIGFILAALVYVVFERTRLGAMLRASVEDRSMAAALGINVPRVMIGTFAVGSALAAFGGVIGVPIMAIRPGLDWSVLILALIVVVIGGLGSVKGAFVGALIIGEVQSLGLAIVPVIAPFALFGAMAIVLTFKPTGLFGRSTA